MIFNELDKKFRISLVYFFYLHACPLVSDDFYLVTHRYLFISIDDILYTIERYLEFS